MIRDADCILRDPKRNVWVIGVDKDQYAEGQVKGTKDNVTLTSMVKKVDTAVEDLTKKASDGKFPGGKTLTYGLAQDAVGISDHKENLSDDVIKATDDWKRISTEVSLSPGSYSALKDFNSFSVEGISSPSAIFFFQSSVALMTSSERFSL